MTWQTGTALVIVAAFLLLAGYDLFAYARGGNEATISHVCLATADRHRGFAVLLSVLFGVLLGHLFLPQHKVVYVPPPPEQKK